VLANVDGPYKGIHPIRMDKHAAMALNRHLAKNLDSIFWGAQAETGGETRAEDMLRWHGVPYLTNSVFVIRQKDWREIVHESPALFVDQWDEVPISRVLERGRALLVDPAIPVIHPAYNTIPTEQEWAEKNFISKITSKSLVGRLFTPACANMSQRMLHCSNNGDVDLFVSPNMLNLNSKNTRNAHAVCIYNNASKLIAVAPVYGAKFPVMNLADYDLYQGSHKLMFSTVRLQQDNVVATDMCGVIEFDWPPHA